MRVKELIQEARDGMVEQEDESATMKMSGAEQAAQICHIYIKPTKNFFRRRRSS